jgi:hypothetical protein
MKLLIPILFFGISLLISGCSTYNFFQTYEDSGESCKTTIEGEVTETRKWVGDAPLLVTRGVGRNFVYRQGEILEHDEEGVLFNENRRSLANNPDPKFYSNDRIFSLIGEDGNILAGEYPDEEYGTSHFLFLIQEIDSEGKIGGIVLEPGEPFSYCADPGEYQLQSIIWERNNGDSDITADNVEFSNSFIIEKNTANYLGNLYVNHIEDRVEAERIVYPMKELSRPDRSTGLVVGFGLTGALFNEIAKDRGIVSMLEFQIVNNEEYESSTGLPLRFTDVY